MKENVADIETNLRAERASAGLVSALSQILVPDMF
jgi:hypothetical protein